MTSPTNTKPIIKKAEDLEKKLPKVPVKSYFTVKMEVMSPVVLTYRIYAESPEEAVTLAVKQSGQQMTSPPQIIWGRLKHLKATVYASGSSLVKYVKNLV
jgi:hypothetical protein